MSQEPWGLCGGTPPAVGACCAIAKVAPTIVSTSESISAKSILVFILIPSAVKNSLGHSEGAESSLGFAAQFLRI
jgi:hypothetical protein